MKPETLLNAIGGIDDIFIEESIPKELNKSTFSKKRKQIFGWVLGGGAGLCAVAAILFLILPQFQDNSPRWPIRIITVNSQFSNEAVPFPILPWSEQPMEMRYPEATYKNLTYTSISKFYDWSWSWDKGWEENTELVRPDNQISLTERLGDALEQVTLIGYDEYASLMGETIPEGDDGYVGENGEIYHKTTATLYTIQNVSTDFAIAVVFDAAPQNAYIYQNRTYKPESWADYVSDLQLQEFLTLGSVTYEQYVTLNDGSSQYCPVVFEQVEDAVIWSMILSRNDAFTYSQTISGEPILFIPGRWDDLGAGITLYDTGHVTVRIGGTTHRFFFNVETITAFRDYVFDHYDGYEIHYHYSTSAAPDGDEEELPIEQTITMTSKPAF